MKSKQHRSRIPRNSCVAQDRVDIAEAVKCLTRHMKEPRSGHTQELKRLGRYPVKNRRCVLTYARQTSEATLQVHVGSDWADDLLVRKSTMGVIVRRGKHLLRHMSCRRLLHCQAEKLSTTLRFEDHARACEFNHITKTG